MWMQHLSGVERQSFASERYSVLDSDINNLWNTLYGGALINLQILMEKAEEEGAVHYLGIGKVLTAFAMMNITSVWGDVPYSDAFKGSEGVLKAQYDSQEMLYGTINTLLDEAIGHFGQQNDPLAVVPGASDLIFKGNLEKWIKTAKTLKVRAALHLAKKNGYGPVRDLVNAGGLISGMSEDFQFNFGAAASEQNPVHQFQVQRGDIRVAKRTADLLNATNDPRTARIIAPNGDGEFVGSGPGEALTTASLIGPGYALNGSIKDNIKTTALEFDRSVNQVKRPDFGFTLGYSLEFDYFRIRLAYSTGLSDILSGPDETLKNRSFNLSTGVRL